MDHGERERERGEELKQQQLTTTTSVYSLIPSRHSFNPGGWMALVRGKREAATDRHHLLASYWPSVVKECVKWDYDYCNIIIIYRVPSTNRINNETADESQNFLPGRGLLLMPLLDCSHHHSSHCLNPPLQVPATNSRLALAGSDYYGRYSTHFTSTLLWRLGATFDDRHWQ